MNRQQAGDSGSYDNEFYADQAPGSQRSANVILPLVFELNRPQSLVDVGCGIGTWLHVAKELGVPTVLGVDGEYALTAGLLIDRREFQPADLRLPLPELGQRFDMAMSLEVAEHLPRERAQSLVNELCSLADVVMFSAAIPGQGGTDHINLQAQSVWIERFAASGYQAFDLVRSRVWDDASVETWYRQNVLVFVKAGNADLTARARELQAAAPRIFDVAHPDLVAFWERRATRPVSVTQAIGLTVRATKTAVSRRVSALRSRN